MKSSRLLRKRMRYSMIFRIAFWISVLAASTTTSSWARMRTRTTSRRMQSTTDSNFTVIHMALLSRSFQLITIRFQCTITSWWKSFSFLYQKVRNCRMFRLISSKTLHKITRCEMINLARKWSSSTISML